VEEESTPNGDFGEPKFVAIGARVGLSGQVFEADGRADLVVKLFTWAAGLPPQVVLDFTRDVMRVADLHHPNIAQVFDAGMLGDGTPFVVMERFAGMTLDEAANGRSLPTAEVIPILRGVGSALSAAHAAGIAHGQLRADNVFIADDPASGPGCPKLLDFGAARLVARAYEIGPSADAFRQRAAERADQLALATLAWRLFDPKSRPAMQRVLMRAMNPDPSQRFGSVMAFVEALEELSMTAAAAGLAAPARPPTGAPPPELASSPSSLTQQFFAEGEQLDRKHAVQDTSVTGAVAEEHDEGQLEAVAAWRVPRSRAQMAAAALLALGSVALIAWTVVSLASKQEPDPRAEPASTATVDIRPVAVSPTALLRPAGPAERRSGRKAGQPRRASPMQPPPFAPARASVTASEPPAPPRSAASATPTLVPPASPLTIEAAPSGSAAGADDEKPPREGTGDDPRSAPPEPSTDSEGTLAPRSSGDVSPAPSTPEASPPPAASPPAAP
jgi:serine/threonine-protein kinase